MSLTQQSEELKDLADALSKAQGKIANAARTNTNPFFKAKYADLADVREACQGPLAANGLSVVQTSELAEGAVVVATTLLHSSGQWIRGRLRVVPAKNDPQGIGSALTYARRYSLAAMVGVATEDDDAQRASHGGHATEPKRPVFQAPPANASAPQESHEAPHESQEAPPADEGPKVYVASVDEKHGTSAKGKWTMFIVKFSDGREATTFDKKDGEFAHVAHNTHAPVYASVVKSARREGKYDLKAIRDAGPPAEPKDGHGPDLAEDDVPF